MALDLDPIARSRRFRLGIDIGGTFTDLSLIDEDTHEAFSHKVQSTPKSPSQAVARGIAEIVGRVGSKASEISSFVHGTTIALNALLERRGAVVGLFVTRGTRDILELGRLRKPDLFNLRAVAAPPLVPRRRVYEVGGRISASGDELEPLDEAALRLAAAELGDDIESVAICLLNAHSSDTHERKAAQIIQQVRPGVHVSRSSALWPEVREFERATVAALNAYVEPIMRRYVDALGEDTTKAGLQTGLFITRSNGGIMSASTARSHPAYTMLSGPAAGVVGAAYVAGQSGVLEAVTLDIGGTSADVAVIRDGAPVQSTEAVIGEYPIIMPSVDVFAVGAGGGSIAWFDQAGLLKLGPKSAGADPGPACYGQGGTEPTTTDAYLVCGYLDPETFAGGAITLHPELAEAAIKPVADRLKVSVEAAAESILRLASATMASAIMPMLTKRGIDTRDFTLAAYGGAGPTHACLLADETSIPRVLVPPAPGALCAYGAAIADIRSDFVRSHRVTIEAADPHELRGILLDLETQARSWLRGERPDVAEVTIRRTAGMRYVGQAFDVEVQVPTDLSTAELTTSKLATLFHAEYEALYRNSDPAAAAEIVDLRVAVIGRTERPGLRQLPSAESGEQPPTVGTRPIYHASEWRSAKIYHRSDLKGGHVVPGPAVIEQADTTTVVLAGTRAECDGNGNLFLMRDGNTDA